LRIHLNKWFQRFASKEGIDDTSFCDAVWRAERGQRDADLGGNVMKQQIGRVGEGKSSGYRTIILYLAGTRAFFVYEYAKSDRNNITKDELRGFKELAKHKLSYDDAQLLSAVRNGALGI